MITPLFGGNDPYTGASIFANGHTYVDTAASPPVIHVAYDTSQAGGQGICVFDTSGNPISTPNVVILYHELSHAYHFALNQVPFPQSQCPAVTDDEPAAEIDENVLRDELGLCDRDVCNHGGQLGVGASCGGSETPGGPPWVLSGKRRQQRWRRRRMLHRHGDHGLAGGLRDPSAQGVTRSGLEPIVDRKIAHRGDLRRILSVQPRCRWRDRG